MYCKVLFSEILLFLCLKVLFTGVVSFVPEGIFGSALLVFVPQGIAWLQCALRYLVASCQQLSQKSKNKVHVIVLLLCLSGVFS